MNKLSRLFVSALAVFCLLLASLPAAAQQPQGGSGLSISPTIAEFNLKPGQASTISITLKNITSGNITAKATVNDFRSDNVTGNPQIITNPNEHSPNSIKSFVLGLEDVPLNKGEQKKITVAMQAPNKLSPGVYYGIIRFKAVPSGLNAPKEGEVVLSASVGTIVLITIPGNLHEQLQLTKLHVYNGHHESSVFIRRPDQAGVEIKNLGNAFSKPFGTVIVENMFGKQVYTYQMNTAEPRSNVLPSSSRVFQHDLKKINQVGRYTLTANVSYGQGNDVLVMRKTFWYIPLWLVIIILAVLLILVLAVTRAYRGYRRGSRSRR